MIVNTGRFLRVNLNTGSYHEESINAEEIQKWTLGSGLAAKIYYDEMDPALDPLDPASPLLVFNGLLSGTLAPTGCRSSWCGRSPLTDIWNEANLGGHWGAELRFAGYDGLVITGRAPKPVYLWIDGTRKTIEFRDASHLWGKDYFEAADALLTETDPQAQLAGIGPAGENLVSISGIMSGPSDYVRAAARGGMGAVLGSKQLKAVVVRGKDRPQYYDKPAFLSEVKAQNATIQTNSEGMSAFGTAGGIISTEMFGDIGLRNWTLGSWEQIEQVSGQTLYGKYLVKHTRCFACPIGCGKEIEVNDEEYPSPRGEGVEYETIAGFGGMVYNSNLESVALANSLCNRYGLDTISTASTIAFAMEAFEKGLIGLDDTDGVDLRFGNADAMIDVVEKIAFRRGFGDILAQGSRAAARHIGKGADALAMHVKGLEVAFHDPRAFMSMAVNYATAIRGGCHLESLTYWNGYGVSLPDLGYPEPLPPHESTPEQAKMVFDFQNHIGVFNPLGLCKFIAKAEVGPESVCHLVNKALGWEWTVDDVLTTGDRLFQLKRLINLRLGVTRADDTLPERFLSQPRPTGYAAGVIPNLDAMLPTYYQLRGWDADGIPTQSRLQQLGIV